MRMRYSEKKTGVGTRVDTDMPCPAQLASELKPAPTSEKARSPNQKLAVRAARRMWVSLGVALP